MEFMGILDRLSLGLAGIAVKASRYSGIADREDLVQEMRLHLWKKWKKRELEGKTESYILQGCWFHVRNYLRTNAARRTRVSLDMPVKEDGASLGEMLPDGSVPLEESSNWKDIAYRINNNGLTPGEKTAFRYSMKGLTLRETGRKMGVSFVMAHKYRKGLRNKWSHKIDW